MSNSVGMGPPPPPRTMGYIIVPYGGLITCATLDEACAKARAWVKTQAREMRVYQVLEVKKFIPIDPPAPGPRVV